jgi:hypothetical protein
LKAGPIADRSALHKSLISSHFRAPIPFSADLSRIYRGR